MSVFKCKMCGGSLEIADGVSTCECEFCGTRQTIPRLDNDKKANLYDRADHFRRNNDYDKAMGIYEQILNDDPSDAEAYWSIVLCRYGIEYVEDPKSHKHIPTVNRTQYTSVFSDEDYKSAIEHADVYQKVIYEEEAKAIDDIQKGILEISSKEEPFDVFICYKETDNNGRRTPDSVLANDMYHQLVKEGFKVFFSRITLEDKLGTAYEPYIFAALNSAKVMVVVGTKPEYFNAVWVKNEWSRYLSLIKNGTDKVLIPAYRDMDPYDLPEEFSHLQAQDMSKLGFMQDLIRGIKKITDKEIAKESAAERVHSSTPDVDPLLKRAFIFLEDGNWKDAVAYCEKVLDRDPENATAYLGKLMAELHVNKREQLADEGRPFNGFDSYRKAVRFGDEGLVSELEGYVAHIKERNDNAKRKGVYDEAVAFIKSGDGVVENDPSKAADHYQKATDLLTQIPGFEDADSLAEGCSKKAAEASNESEYRKAMSLVSNDSITSYEKAILIFTSIIDWKDSKEQIEISRKRINEIKEKEEADRKEREERKRKEEAEAAERRKRKKKVGIIAALAVIGVVIVVFIIVMVVIPKAEYDNAMQQFNNENYEEAWERFSSIDYGNSAEMAKESYYSLCVQTYNDGNYAKAKSRLSYFQKNYGEYKDSEKIFNECDNAENYKHAIELLDSGNYKEAMLIFETIQGYKDSWEKANECKIKIEQIEDQQFDKLKEAIIKLSSNQAGSDADTYRYSLESRESVYIYYTFEYDENQDTITFNKIDGTNQYKGVVTWQVRESLVFTRDDAFTYLFNANGSIYSEIKDEFIGEGYETGSIHGISKHSYVKLNGKTYLLNNYSIDHDISDSILDYYGYSFMNKQYEEFFCSRAADTIEEFIECLNRPDMGMDAESFGFYN